MFIATLIADGSLDQALLSEIAHQFDQDCTAGTLTGVSWLDEGWAADLLFDPADGVTQSDCAEIAEAIREQACSIVQEGFGLDLKLDVVVQPAANRQKKLLIADMDSTMITVECIDELADYAGIKPQIAEVTERAMRGELDFAAALDARVALLKGLGEDAIERCLAERVRITPGAEALVKTMRANGAETILISGGFTRFAEPVARQIGFARAIANRLMIADGMLDGTVAKPIVDSGTKEATLVEAIATLGLDPADTLAVGDGANDLAMIRRAGLGVAFHAKPIVAAAAGARIDHGDLSALLYALGYARDRWVVA
ncbi:phosphoserine phosphatase SerB [Sphingomonas sp. PL-96]|uniref:phosphoserine phosphatase SerB n=1 Tax=Sphingomonas sp. PL-96 TaxID=2887201 RepID=UPI001E423DA1|nr:phosphoserine phosphatase SerB [Sphingomonas sp. PL-96]MCC2976416.1 phosphoserine phosphatase SerB [Sphingomonas sp. PL-96]